jgi:SAM-dependent methyltransferase
MNDGRANSDVRDTLAPGYDAWYETPLRAFVLGVELAALVGLAGEFVSRYVLEVGCGTRRFGRAFAERGARVTGVGLSRAMLSEVGMDEKGRPNLCQAGAGRLTFQPSSFGLVLAVTLLESVPDPRGVLGEMWRVLRPGGRLLVGALNARSPWALARHRSALEPFARARFFSPPDFRDMLGCFGRVTWRGAVFIPPWMKGHVHAFWGEFERIGAGILPWFGAFLGGCVRKQLGG